MYAKHAFVSNLHSLVYIYIHIYWYKRIFRRFGKAGRKATAFDAQRWQASSSKRMFLLMALLASFLNGAPVWLDILARTKYRSALEKPKMEARRWRWHTGLSRSGATGHHGNAPSSPAGWIKAIHMRCRRRKKVRQRARAHSSSAGKIRGRRMSWRNRGHKNGYPTFQ